MKKFNILYLLLFLAAGIFTGCLEDETDVIDGVPEGAYPDVTDVVNGIYDLTNIADATTGFTVTSYGVDVSSITIMKSLNGGAKVEQETINGSTGAVTIPVASAVAGTGVAVGDLELGDVFEFSFVLNTADGRNLTPVYPVAVPLSCPSSLEGMYEMTTTYGYHDFLPDFATNTIDVEIVRVSEGVYSVVDFSGGLYAADGPYGLNYGTAGMPAQFSDVCNNISWAGQSDPWGAMIPGGVNSVDGGSGVITISWLCEGYGENGVSVYTPK